jgi:hypothetical protein
MKKVSFDYDGTLAKPSVERYAKELVDRGFEVWVVTARVGDDDKSFQPWKQPDWNRDLWDSCERIGIPKERVMFTNFVEKIKFLKGKNFVFHLDDDEYELLTISEDGDECVPVNVNNPKWEYYCKKLLGYGRKI